MGREGGAKVWDVPCWKFASDRSAVEASSLIVRFIEAESKAASLVGLLFKDESMLSCYVGCRLICTGMAPHIY